MFNYALHIVHKAISKIIAYFYHDKIHKDIMSEFLNYLLIATTCTSLTINTILLDNVM